MKTLSILMLLVAQTALGAEVKTDVPAPETSTKTFELAPKVGFFKTTTPANGAFFAGLELGVVTPALDHRLQIAFEADWHMPTTGGTLTSDQLTVDGTTAPSDYTLIDREWGFLLSAIYRLPLSEHFTAYVGAGPSLYYHRETVFAFGSTTVESESNFGFQALAGAELVAGPGALFLELHYHFTNVDFLGTGKVNLGGFLAAGVGYRLSF